MKTKVQKKRSNLGQFSAEDIVDMFYMLYGTASEQEIAAERFKQRLLRDVGYGFIENNRKAMVVMNATA